ANVEARHRQGGFDQIHVVRLCRPIVQRQTPVISFGIAGISLVPPPTCRVSPPEPSDKYIVVRKTEIDPDRPLCLCNWERAAICRPPIASGIDCNLTDTDLNAIRPCPGRKRRAGIAKNGRACRAQAAVQMNVDCQIFLPSLGFLGFEIDIFYCNTPCLVWLPMQRRRKTNFAFTGFFRPET